MLGTTIKIKPEHQKFFDAYTESAEAKDGLISRLSHSLQNERKDFWKSLKELYPKTKGYSCVVNHKRMEITLLYKEGKH